ncbi:MAG: macro domain-containing protein [Eggerthellaceae bacterium]
MSADAIVVAANEHLQITGGVGYTVALSAGLKQVQAACNRIGFCPCGSAVATPAFGLDANLIIHAVGPHWCGGNRNEELVLRSTYDSALACAMDAGAKSIALPLISAGTYGFPADISLSVAREAIRDFTGEHDDVDVKLVLFSREALAAGISAYLDIAEFIDDHYVCEHSYHRGDFGESALDESREEIASQRPRFTESVRSQGARMAERISDAFGGSRGKKKWRQDADSLPAEPPCPGGSIQAAGALPSSEPLEDLLSSLDASFSTTVLALIDERGMTDSEVYKRANMSRQLFSKIRSNPGYQPSKKTALALAVALGLSVDETQGLLSRAGFTLSRSSKADVIVEYFISRGNYDIFQINEALYAFDQPLL